MSFFDRFKILNRKGPEGLAPEARPSPVQAAIERRQRKRKNARQGATALIIDDSPTVVAALRKILRSAGYVTRDAADAETGLAMLADGKPDLIFLDIVLPGMNGFGALRVIRKDPATTAIPVIMISGNEHATEQFYANRIGADDFMKKPFSRFEVFARIEMLLDANRELRRKGSAAASAAPLPHTATQPLAVPHPGPAVAAAPAASAPQPPVPVDGANTLTPWPELEARKQLTAMGLQYYDTNQFLAAITRSDRLAVALFMAGKGVDPAGPLVGKSARTLAQEIGNPDIVQLLG